MPTEKDSKSKKKILYIITKSVLGGAGHYVYDLALSFSKREYDVSVAMGGDGELKQKLDDLKIETHTLANLERDVSILKEFKVLIDLIKIIKKERPHIVHVNSSKIGGLGALATHINNLLSSLPTNKDESNKNKAKVVFTAHGWAHKEKRKTYAVLIIRFISWLTVMLSSKTIAVSEDDRRKSPKLWIKRNKIRVIHNGPRLTKFISRKLARDVILSEKKYSEKETYIFGDLAELHKNKGLSYALTAFSELLKDPALFGIKYKHIVFVLIGGGEEETFLKEKVKELEITENVIFMGHVPQGARLLKGFDAFIFPSIKEGFPYALLEAGHAGLSCIASNTGGIPEVITDMDSGILVRPAITQEIVQAMRFLITQKRKSSEMGRKLKEFVTKEFTLEKMISETDSVYKELL